jgi:hypothetical protein
MRVPIGCSVGDIDSGARRNRDSADGDGGCGCPVESLNGGFEA